MQDVLSLPGRERTFFYFTDLGADGFSKSQQRYIMGLIREYRERFPRLLITGVWDFGKEEGSPYEGEKYGDFASCRDNAVFNNALYSISYNHIRVSRMPDDLDAGALAEILRRYEAVRQVSETAAALRTELMNRGTPPARIRAAADSAAGRILEEKGMPPLGTAQDEGLIAPGPHNHLSLCDPLFADVWAIRRLEETMSIRRLTVHELGHAISESYGILNDKRVRKLFGKCRDGFEDLDEFCAECFMASELTDRIPLAQNYAALVREAAGL